MVTTEILQSLGYSSLREYFERIYTLDMEADGNGSTDAELMHDELSEEQQAEYEMFTTDYYYEYHDNKNSEQIVSSKTLYASKIIKVHEYEVCFYWPDANGYEWIRNIHEWYLGADSRRAYMVESEQQADEMCNDKQFLNNYIK